MRPSVMTGVDCNDAETLVRDVIASCKLIAPKAPLVLCYYPWHDSGPFPPRGLPGTGVQQRVLPSWFE